MMLGVTVVATFAAPIAIPVSIAVDLAHGRMRLPTLRLYAFVLQYLVNDTAEILVAPMLWIVAGFGTRLGSRASMNRHESVQRWSIALLARRAEQLFGLRVELDDDRALVPGPAIVLCHHVSSADASLPLFLYLVGRDYHVRSVIMAELLADPGFDLLYQRLGSVFIDRDGGETARHTIRQLVHNLDEQTVAVIFPEGRLFQPELRDRILARLAEKDPERAIRLDGLRHVLPPRPGGVLELLDAAPDADVVVIAHAGFEQITSLAQLRSLPPELPIRVTVWRVKRKDIPTERDGQIRWLDELWSQVDNHVEAMLPAASPDTPTEPKDG